MFFRKEYFVFVVFLTFLSFPKTSFAQLECCSEHGGNYACDFATHKLYCKDGTVSTACSCSQQNTPTPTPGPTNTPTSTPTTPPCPNFSKYDKTSKTCKCISGYVVNDNACISNAEYCWIKHGGNAEYDKDKNSCTCPQGYTFNSDGSKCITLGQLCRNKLGEKSYYNSDTNACVCYQGYSIQNNSCQLVPTQAVSIQKTSVVIPTDTPKPTPTLTLTPTPTKKPQIVTPTFGAKKLGKQFSIEPIKKQPNIFVELLQSIWDFVRKLI